MKSDLESLQAENSRLKKTVEDLWTINRLARIISSTMPIDEILDAVVAASLKALDAQQGTISLLDSVEQKDGRGEDNAGAFKTLIRKADTAASGTKFRLNEKLSDWMIQNRKPLVINDVANDATFKELKLLSREIQSILSVPLLSKGELIGVVNIFNKKGSDEFTKDDQRLLAIIASQSAQTIENARLYEKEKQLRRYQHELDLARKIQRGLVPHAVPRAADLEIATYFNPADKVGGDYFDFFELSHNQLGIVLADVSGHGPSAALVMTMVKGIIHAMATEFESPRRVLAEVNSLLDRIGPKDMFVTMVFLVFDPTTRMLRFSNAGHNPIVHYEHKTTSCKMVHLMGPALSISHTSKFSEKEIQLNERDVIFVYTDGVTEAFDKAGQMFGEDRLMTAVQAASSGRAGAIVEDVKKHLSDFTSAEPQRDDIAIIAVKVV